MVFIFTLGLSIFMELGANKPFSNALAEKESESLGAFISYASSLSLKETFWAIISMGWIEFVSSKFTELTLRS